MKKIFIMILITLITLACMSNSLATTQPANCQPATDQQIEFVQAGLVSVASDNYAGNCFSVRSKDYESVYMLACLIYGPGIEEGVEPGVWAHGGEPDNPAIIMSVNGFAKEFSVFPDASKTDAQITLSAHGVSEAEACASQK